MDDPTCIGCGEKYKTQKQLSAQAARCSNSKSLTLGDVLSNWRENESREQETSSVMQRGLVYPTWLTNRLKSLIFIKKTRFT
jgi:hypothetical protein